MKVKCFGCREKYDERIWIVIYSKIYNFIHRNDIMMSILLCPKCEDIEWQKFFNRLNEMFKSDKNKE